MTETITTPSMPEFLKMMLDHRLRGTQTALSGKVVSYNRETQRATVQPTTKLPFPKKDGTFEFRVHPEIPDSKVMFIRPKGVVMHYDLQVGEGVLLLATTFSIEQYLRTAEISEPGDLRVHVISNCVVIPGLDVDADVMEGMGEDGLQLGLRDGPPIFFTQDQVRIGSIDANKKAARNGDPVQVTIPPNTVVIAVSGGTGTLNPSPIEVDGTIQDGSNTVFIAD